MKILLLQLSDIHIRQSTDPILGRAQKIVDAIKGVEPSIDCAVCILSGDIVYSGTSDQFELALSFIAELKSQLDGALPRTPLHFVAVPGNHDCDFKDSMAVRESVLPDVLKKPDLLAETSHAIICLDPLKRFDEFIHTLDLLPEVSFGAVSPLILREHQLLINGELISFLCYNTAATSRLHEQPGTLVFPNAVIPKHKRTDAVVVSIYHHPTNWLEPVCSREFRSKVEAISDIILTGHEHTLDRRHITSASADTSYVEAGALQDSENPETSEFNLILLDTFDKKRRIIIYEWKDGQYRPQNCTDPAQFHLWEDFQPNAYRTRENFPLLAAFAEKLEDPEITLTHRTKGQLKLSDVYVFPDLKRFNQPGEKGKKESVRGDEIVSLTQQKPSLFIVGDDQTGKTALAKRLFVSLRQAGDVPVYIDAAVYHITLKGCGQDIENAFLRNYSESALNAYRQCDRAKRVVIIDNYHRAKVAPRDRHALLAEVKRHAFRVIVLAHDTALTVHDLTESATGADGEPPFAYYGIRPFSLAQQNKVIEKWLLLNGDASHNTGPFVANLERLRRTMDTVFGKNYVPAYPPYLMAILQANESGTDLDLKANTHGYFYELFIKQSIAKHSSSSVMMNILSGYLSHVAYWMYSHDCTDLREDQLRELHAGLHERFEVLPDFGQQASQLEKMQLLTKVNDSFHFRHPYIFYYFLAYYLNDHLDEAEVAQAINSMAQELFREQSASTLLFLSHLSKDSRILETLLAACEAQYVDAPSANLDNDVGFLNDLSGEIQSLMVADGSLAEMRQRELERLDVCRNDELAYEEENRKEIEAHDTLLGQLNAALKTIQILGQFLKNFPANLDRSKKDRVISACCDLARRALGAYLHIVRENESAFLRDMVFIIASRKPEISESKLKEHAVTAVVTLSELASSGMIARLSYSLGSSELMNTYDRYFQSVDASFLRLVYTALKLDHYSSFPELHLRDEVEYLRKNPFAFKLLQQLVVRHMFMFPVDFRLRQKMSVLLKLDYKKLTVPKPDQRLLKEKV